MQQTVIIHKGDSGVFAGGLSCVFGVLGVFTLGILFVPLAAICSIVGVIEGHQEGVNRESGFPFLEVSWRLRVLCSRPVYGFCSPRDCDAPLV